MFAAYWCPGEILINMFEIFSSKMEIPKSLTKADPRGSTALHALCCNRHFIDRDSKVEKNLNHFESCIKWLKQKGIRNY